MNLLSKNSKLKKGKNNVWGLSLAPSKHSGYNVCKFAGACIDSCSLWFSGHLVMKPVREAMIRRTHLFFQDQSYFLRLLYSDLDSLSNYENTYVRLNVASDIPWENFSVIEDFPNITFYDYTKYPSRFIGYCRGNLPPNYFLTYSYNEQTNFLFPDYKKYIRMGGNVAVVFNVKYNPQHKIFGNLPSRWNGFDVIDGDTQDVRTPELDGFGKIVGLRLKGTLESKENARKSSFSMG